MQRQPTTTQVPQGGAAKASEQRFRDQGETNDREADAGEAEADATTLAFDGSMTVSGDDGFSGDPYNRTGSFKRPNR